METSPKKQEVTSKLEGPILRRVAELSANEYLQQPEEHREEWLRNQLQQKLPQEFLTEAFLFGNPKCSFRCFKRSSDGTPILAEHPDSTYANAISNVHQIGIEIDGRLPGLNIESGQPWMRFFMPTEDELNRVDISTALVYRDQPFVRQHSETHASLLNVPGKYTGQLISVADSQDYNTLRDNLIGYIEVHWQKTEQPAESRFPMRSVLKKLRARLIGNMGVK